MENQNFIDINRSWRQVMPGVMQISFKLRIVAAVAGLVLCAATGTAVLAWNYRVAHQNGQQSPKESREYRDGKREAERDLVNGHLRYRTYGIPEEGDGPNLFAEHLLNDYDIELVRVAGCEISTQLENRTAGYNDAMLAVIETRYGIGIFERVEKQAAEESMTLSLTLPHGGPSSAHHFSFNSPVAEYGPICWEEEKARLDNLAIMMLHTDRTTLGHIIVYDGKYACRGEAVARALRARKYLVDYRKVEADRIVWRWGGYQSEMTTTLVLHPSGASIWPLKPSIPVAEVTFVGNCNRKVRPVKCPKW